MQWKSLEHIPKPIYLGSGSPRRKELFGCLFNSFEIVATEAELQQQFGDAVDFVVKNARFKVYKIFEEHDLRHNKGTLFTFDTVVTFENKILGKPDSLNQARQMLTELRGRNHQVITAYCVYNLVEDRELFSSFSTTEVKFLDYSDALIDQYLESKESLDKAGSYGIQGYGRLLVESINGCYYNVVGLPVSSLFNALQSTIR